MEFILMDVDASSEIVSSKGIIILVVAALIAIAAIVAVFIWRKKEKQKLMNLLLTLLDGVPPEALLGMGLLFIVLPIAALLLLIWLFKKYKRKNE